MIVGVLDTHTILWFLSGDPRLSTTARNFIVNASYAGNDWQFPQSRLLRWFT